MLTRKLHDISLFNALFQDNSKAVTAAMETVGTLHPAWLLEPLWTNGSILCVCLHAAADCRRVQIARRGEERVVRGPAFDRELQ